MTILQSPIEAPLRGCWPFAFNEQAYPTPWGGGCAGTVSLRVPLGFYPAVVETFHWPPALIVIPENANLGISARPGAKWLLIAAVSTVTWAPFIEWNTETFARRAAGQR